MTKDQTRRAAEMLAFLEASQLSPDLEWTKDRDFLLHFEAHRSLIVQNLLTEAGLKPDEEFEVLDFGYLHGLTQEFLHRAFPKARITVCDRPSSPIFSDQKYLEKIRERKYLSLLPREIDDLPGDAKKYRVLVLGEIIEHLDPTQVARALQKLRAIIEPDGVMVITTPNASSFYNCFRTLGDKGDVTFPPIPNETHGNEHIHLWSVGVLNQTAKHFGWKCLGVEFYHGREAEIFALHNREWISLKSQLMMRGMKLWADLRPQNRGFFVATYGPVKSETVTRL